VGKIWEKIIKDNHIVPFLVINAKPAEVTCLANQITVETYSKPAKG